MGERVRNPNLRDSVVFLKQSQSWNLERLRSYQLERCQKLVKFVYAHSSYYKKRFDQCGFSVDQFTDLDQLHQIPIVSKENLIENNEAIHTTKKYCFKKLFISETSGSTGQSLTFMKDEKWDSWNRATIFRGLSWYGVEPWRRNGYFWGYNIDPSKAWKIRLLDTLQNRFRVFSYDRKKLTSFIQKLESATYLHGYSSMIYEVARIINEDGIDTSHMNLKLVKGTSEKIHEHYHDEIQRAFGQKIVSEYGAAEAGIIAFECPHGSMHLNMEGCIVEEDNNDGEIIVTNLNAYSFPIIRYKLGDFIKLEDENYTCSCGMQHRILKEVTGRVGKRILGYTGTYPSFIVYYVFKNIYMDTGIAINGQFIQRKKGHLEVKVENSLTDELRYKFIRELKSYFGNDMNFDIKDNTMIHLMDGKRKDFVSKIH